MCYIWAFNRKMNRCIHVNCLSDEHMTFDIGRDIHCSLRDHASMSNVIFSWQIQQLSYNVLLCVISKKIFPIIVTSTQELFKNTLILEIIFLISWLSSFFSVSQESTCSQCYCEQTTLFLAKGTAQRQVEKQPIILLILFLFLVT